jgi:hypothetical protein
VVVLVFFVDIGCFCSLGDAIRVCFGEERVQRSSYCLNVATEACYGSLNVGGRGGACLCNTVVAFEGKIGAAKVKAAKESERTEVSRVEECMMLIRMEV